MTLTASFIVTTLLFLLFFYLGTGRNKRVLLVSALWIFLISTLSLIGFFQNKNTIPPRFVIVLFGNTLLVAYLYEKLKSIVIDYPFSMLIHALRIPIEVTLYLLFLQRQVPEIMTFRGWNFDIIIGASAFIFFFLNQLFKIKPSKKPLLIWNFIGLLLLLNIVVIAILSAPLPVQQLSFDQPNLAVLCFPYILLPSIIVPIVLLTHILTIKQMMTS